MVFNSLAFIAFFAIVLALHSLPFSWTVKKFNLLIASYLFYAAWNPPFVILLWVSTVVDWYAAQKLVHTETPMARRAWMLLSVVANLGMLGYFKYGTFMLDNFSVMMAALGAHYQAPTLDIVLPVGISFYTFATMSYTLDVYMRRAAPARNFLDYALFVTFFPHLVAGPIMRPTELVPQFASARTATRNMLFFGLALMTIGMFEKIVLADEFLAKAVEMVYDGKKIPGMLDSWFATIAFGAQIFCDFAGYSTTAIGAAMCLGFVMPDNFRFPYAAIGFTDFWRRWHITLSTWLRDYLYIPLGGNRQGETRTFLALAATMLLGGLWHGASWTFVVWGGLHGLYLIVERWLKKTFSAWSPGPLALFALGMLTYLLIELTWVFFRSHSFGGAWLILCGMFGQNTNSSPILPTALLAFVAICVSGILVTHWNMRTRTLESAIAATHPYVITVVWAFMAFAITIAQGSGDAFIYFQF